MASSQRSSVADAFASSLCTSAPNRTSSGIRESIATGNSVMHRTITKGRSTFAAFGRREATCSVKEMENMTDGRSRIRRPCFIFRTCIGTQAHPDSFMRIHL